MGVRPIWPPDFLHCAGWQAAHSIDRKMLIGTMPRLRGIFGAVDQLKKGPAPAFMTQHGYATPTDDMNSWRGASPAPGQLPLHLVAFVQGGVAPILGVRGTDGRPLVGSGVACSVREAIVVRLFVASARNAPLLEAVKAGSAVAATFSRARDHRSIQLKAPSARLYDPEPEDLPEISRQCAILSDELVELGYTRAQALAYTAFDPVALAVVEFRPDRVFTQTPGPGAGAELRR